MLADYLAVLLCQTPLNLSDNETAFHVSPHYSRNPYEKMNKITGCLPNVKNYYYWCEHLQ